ncbi:TPA: glutathione S-transferase family protein [Burkholderia aenigmatica]|uniref:glutathione S-transferase family protein n=1 Tax=Burkholderia sp. AU45251 TaxID=3059204 RepID=UPI0026542349|nr:glutathione S-transferase family protein [Burkholderia sp. AU45251]HDR9487764.1 glutathione S-transferase family protein [Burkholderia aenigmatica]MDN7520681.1 glutathione S-transferase family protein [Burkholderia sp. AU45251]HDR9519542.1 glutathione S-transferase family protein [Burkholderia aenigmatica]HDR9596572.1 glutathione S-transferase family protein [Burkholderia aenigmatica]HDR9603949.1 glutathione S-transferase family protein [Burkholderia aenigmatica]
MSYILYYTPGAASMAVHWMLLELGVPFETRLVDIDTGAQRNPEYLRLNSSGRVPTLVIDGIPRGESTALLMLLAERHPSSGFAPQPNSPERSEWFETMIYLANTLLPAMRSWFYAEVDGKPQNAAAVKEFACGQIEGAMEHLNSLLGDGRQFLIDNRLSTADFLALMLMRWTRNMPRPATSWPNLAGYIQRLRGRQTFLDLNAREGLTEWLNPTP